MPSSGDSLRVRHQNKSSSYPDMPFNQTLDGIFCGLALIFIFAEPPSLTMANDRRRAGDIADCTGRDGTDIGGSIVTAVARASSTVTPCALASGSRPPLNH